MKTLFTIGILSIVLIISACDPRDVRSPQNQNTSAPSLSPTRIEPISVENRSRDVDGEPSTLFDKRLYARKRRLIEKLSALTELDAQLINTHQTKQTAELRKRAIWSLIDDIAALGGQPHSELRRSEDLIALARLCLILRYHGGRSSISAPLAYEIAFFRIVKKTASEFRGDPLAMQNLELLRREVDGTDGLDFSLSVGGFEPRFLYGEEPNEEESDLLERVAKEETSRSPEQQKPGPTK